MWTTIDPVLVVCASLYFMPFGGAVNARLDFAFHAGEYVTAAELAGAALWSDTPIKIGIRGQRRL